MRWLRYQARPQKFLGGDKFKVDRRSKMGRKERDTLCATKEGDFIELQKLGHERYFSAELLTRWLLERQPRRHLNPAPLSTLLSQNIGVGPSPLFNEPSG